MTDYAAARANMIESQVRPNGITDRRIIAAMENVAREDFVPETRKAVAYMDEDIALTANDSAGGERYLIEAMAFARMLQQVAVKPGDRVLVVGTATGYSAAVLAALAAEIVAVESDMRLIREARVNLREFTHVKIVEAALEAGSKADGPFDVIVLEGRVDEVPAALLAQLADGGRLIAVVGETAMAKARVYQSSAGSIATRDVFDASVAPLPGFARKQPAFVF